LFDCTQGLLYLLFGLGNRTLDSSDSSDVSAIRVPVEERKGRDHVGRFEQVPRSDGLLGAGTHGDCEDVVVWQRGSAEGAEHVYWMKSQ
jgi:hypothetical protein